MTIVYILGAVIAAAVAIVALAVAVDHSHHKPRHAINDQPMHEGANDAYPGELRLINDEMAADRAERGQGRG